MRPIFLVVIIMLTTYQSHPQIANSKVQQKIKTIGKNVLTQQNLNAKEFLFPENIHKLYIDSVSGYATVQLRKLNKKGKVSSLTGTVLVYDPSKDEVRWLKKIDYSSGSIYQKSNILVQYKGNKRFRLNIENGAEIWETKNELYYYNIPKNIVIGYKDNGLVGNNHTLIGMNLDNSNTIWERELNREYGWNKIIKMSDSTLIITTGGLHFLNISNGQGWDYHTITGKKDYTETIAKNVAGIALGVLTGTAIVSSGPNLVSDVLSNEIIDGNHIYLASKEKVGCIDKLSGEIIWSYALPEDQTSKSSLFIKGNSLYLINKGFAYWGNKRISYGKPFIKVFDKDTGKEELSFSIEPENESILDFKVSEDTILLVFKDKIETYSLKDGLKQLSKKFEINELGELRFILTDKLYRQAEKDMLANIAQSGNFNTYIQTGKGITLQLDNQLNITDQFNFNQLFFHFFTVDEYKFLSKGNQTVVINKTNQIIAELDFSDKLFVANNKLYVVYENSLCELDLNKLFGIN